MLFTSNIKQIIMQQFKKILGLIVKYGGWVVAAATYLLTQLGGN